MAFERVVSQIQSEISQWSTSFVENLPEYLAAVIVLIVFWIAASIIAFIIRNGLKKTTASNQIARFIARIAKIAIILAGLILALSVANLDKTVTSLLAGAGIVGLALGFAFQDIAVNLIAGGTFLLRKPFVPGEIIETNDYVGNVESITLRNTIIKTFDGQRVLIPNKSIFETPLKNYSRDKSRRVDIECGVSYDTDLERAAQIAKDAIGELSFVKKQKDVQVFFHTFNNSSIDFQLRFWIDFKDKQADYLVAKHSAIIALKQAFDKEGIDIPFPIRTVYMNKQ